MPKLVLLSHCLVNRLAKYAPGGEENYRIPRWLAEHDIAILQMPCPEFTLYGGRRWGHVREQFDNPFFRSHCRALMDGVLKEAEEYRSLGHEVLGVLGIKGSPSCGVSHSCSNPDWGGEAGSDGTTGPAASVEEPGIFMEELGTMLRERNLPIPLLEVDEEDIASALEALKILAAS